MSIQLGQRKRLFNENQYFNHYFNCFFSLALTALFIYATPLSYAKGWKVERRDDGVVVSTRDEPGRDLPSFKGTGLVKAGMFELLAILRDGKRRKEWMTRSGVTRVLRRLSDWEAVSYQQTLAPWPVSDRDVVMKTSIYQRPETQEIIATFNFERWTKPIKGVDRDDYVLMPYLKGYWRLVPISDQETEVTYMVNTDPGGLLPRVLIKRISRDLPYWTLLGLRQQAKKGFSRYQAFLNDYDPKRAGDQVKSRPPAPPAHVIQYLD